MSEKDMVISERYLRNKLEDTEALLAAAQRTIEEQAAQLANAQGMIETLETEMARLTRSTWHERM